MQRIGIQHRLRALVPVMLAWALSPGCVSSSLGEDGAGRGCSDGHGLELIMIPWDAGKAVSREYRVVNRSKTDAFEYTSRLFDSPMALRQVLSSAGWVQMLYGVCGVGLMRSRLQPGESRRFVVRSGISPPFMTMPDISQPEFFDLEWVGLERIGLHATNMRTQRSQSFWASPAPLPIASMNGVGFGPRVERVENVSAGELGK